MAKGLQQNKELPHPAISGVTPETTRVTRVLPTNLLRTYPRQVFHRPIGLVLP
jgi:hypothetical protein